MQGNGQKNSQRRANGKLTPGEGRRAVIATAAITGLMLLTFFVTAGSIVAPDRSDNTSMSVSKLTPMPASEKQGEGAQRVGSIVVEAGPKGRCEERHFDNRTGKMVSANFVDCDARLDRDTTPSDGTNRERIRAILGAFKK
jgi:hypothetical protein